MCGEYLYGDECGRCRGETFRSARQETKPPGPNRRRRVFRCASGTGVRRDGRRGLRRTGTRPSSSRHCRGRRAPWSPRSARHESRAGRITLGADRRGDPGQAGGSHQGLAQGARWLRQEVLVLRHAACARCEPLPPPRGHHRRSPRVVSPPSRTRVDGDPHWPLRPGFRGSYYAFSAFGPPPGRRPGRPVPCRERRGYGDRRVTPRSHTYVGWPRRPAFAHAAAEWCRSGPAPYEAMAYARGVPNSGVAGCRGRAPNRLGRGHHYGLSRRDRRGPRRDGGSRRGASLHLPPRLSVFA